MNVAKIITALVACALLSSCASLERINQKMDSAEASGVQAEHALESLRQKRGNSFTVDDKPWVSKTPVPVAPKASLDPALKCPMTFAAARPVSIFQIAQSITSVCRIPVRVSPDVLAAGQTGNVGAPTGGVAQGGQAPLPPLSPPAATHVAAGNTGLSFAPARPTTISDLVWEGKPLSEFLDTVTARLGLNWKYRDGVVQISYLETRVFRLWARAGKTGLETTVTTGNTVTNATGSASTQGESSGSTGVGSSQTTKVSMESDMAKDIQLNVAAMLTPAGRYAYAPSTGALTITDTPEALDRVAMYVDQENKTITQNVLLNIKVLEVTLEDADSLGLDWSVVYKSLSGNYGINLAGAANLGADVMTGSVGVLDTATGRAGQFRGSEAVIQALRTQGNVHMVREPSVTTLNMKTAPVQISKDTTYVAQSSQTNTANVGSQQALTPGVVTTGFSMNLLPFITSNPDMLLDFSMNFSPDPVVTPVKDKDGQTLMDKPTIERRLFQQSVKIRSGQTLVLSGFEERAESSSKRGVNESGNWWFGGGGTAKGRRMVLVILVTPLILD